MANQNREYRKKIHKVNQVEPRPPGTCRLDPGLLYKSGLILPPLLDMTCRCTIPFFLYTLEGNIVTGSESTVHSSRSLGSRTKREY